jgi:phage shock protein PspC (stress-responsive transcriptional regulator)
METRVDDRRLRRSRRERVLFGVCGGLGEYFEIDPVLIRVAFVLISLAGGAGILAYLILAVVLPEEGALAEPGQAGLRRNVESLRTNAGEIAGDLRAGFQGNSGVSVDEAGERPASAGRSPQLIGLLLIGLGLLFLANTFGWFGWWSWRQFWPVVLIVLGLAIFLRRR